MHAAGVAPRLHASSTRDVTHPLLRGIRSAQVGLLVNTVLALAKLVAGIVGHSYALVADAIESVADIVSSLVVWSGLRIAARDPNESYPFGYGKAEALAAAVVSLMLLGAAIGVGVTAAREIRTPHHTPAPWTLGVLVGVLLVKLVLFRRISSVALEVGSTAVAADAWHHLSDALTSAAAFVGITIALIGGPGWESADDWAALLAALIIAYNGIALLKPALDDLMDRMPSDAVVRQVRAAAEGVPDVLAVEKLSVRKAGAMYHVDIHVQADGAMPLDAAHALGGGVKGAIRKAVPGVRGVLVHMEPYEERREL